MKTTTVLVFHTFVAMTLGPLGLPVQAQQPKPSFTIDGPLPLPVTVENSITVESSGTSSVENVNEPGRQPYEAYIEFNTFACGGFNCSNFNTLGSVFLFDGPEVPAGKRLIIQHVSGRLPNSDSTDVSIALQNSQILSQQHVKWAFYGPFYMQGSLAGLSAQLFTTYGPGERPHFNLILPNSNNFIGYVTVSGYLIDAN